MNDVQGSTDAPKTRGRTGGWKAVLLKAAGFGAGFAIATALLLALAVWWSGRPQAWSDTEITAKPADLYVIETDAEVAVQFRYAFTNHTSAEYTLPAADMGTLMRRLRGDATLDKLERTTSDGTIRIPPNQSIAVTFTVPFRFRTITSRVRESMKTSSISS